VYERNRNISQRKVFGPKRDEVFWIWRRLYNEDLHDPVLLTKYYSAIKSRMRWAGRVARMRERRVAYRILVGKPERKRPLGRPRCRWEYNIEMNL
jgi:hypothetical protein